jgi:hypothetical protein
MVFLGMGLAAIALGFAVPSEELRGVGVALTSTTAVLRGGIYWWGVEERPSSLGG